MNKLFLGILLLTVMSVGAKAQATLGVKGGINFSKINTDNLSESSVTGYQVGVFGRIGGDLYLQPELYLGSRGGKFDFSNNNNTTTTESKVTFTTLNVPLLVGKRFGGQVLNFRVMGGPVYTYNLSKNQDFSDNVNGAFTDFGKYKNSTLGFQVGGGVDIGNITADLRYEAGLTKINENYGQRPSLWALSVGFRIF